MNRIIAFDIGDKRIGIAVTDPFGEMALPLETYRRISLDKDLEYLLNVAKEKNAVKIVCGLPLNFDGSESEQTVKTRNFIDKLREKTNIEIVIADERFTTLMARRVLIEADMRREKRKDVIDKIAASYILDNYLQKMKNIGNNN